MTDPASAPVENLERAGHAVSTAGSPTTDTGVLRRWNQPASALPGMVYEFFLRPDDTREFAHVSDASRAMFGLEPAEIEAEGTRLSGLMHADDVARIDTAILESARTLAPFHQRMRHVVRGEVRWHECFSQPERLADGSVRWKGVLLDITEQRRVEGEQRRARFALEHSIDPVYWVRRDASLEYVNPAASRALGYTREELMRMTVLDLDPNVNRENWPGIWEDTCRVGSRILFTAHRTKDGRILPVEIATSFVEFEDEEFNCCFARDITERKRTEEDVREQACLLAESQRVARLGHYVFDARTGVWTCSPVLEDIFGISPQYPHTIEGWLGLVHPDDCERMQHHLLDEVVGQRKPFNREYRIRRVSDGVERWMHGLGEIHLGPDGLPATMMGTIQDITEQKLASDEIVRLNAQLEHRVAERTAQLAEANKELEAFAYSISHDLRAPLRHIDGFVDLLGRACRDRLDETGQRYLGIISGAARKMGRLIDDLLAFSRFGRTELHFARVSLDELVDETLEILAPDTRGRRIQWFRQPLPSVMCDPAMLKQVFVNLIGNAVKYTRDRSPAEITIATTEGSHPHEVVLFVRDNGAGFDMAYAHKLFGVFQRLHREEEFEGTGVGLANVRRIIARHGGRTWAEGQSGVGATFYFTLPTGTDQTA